MILEKTFQNINIIVLSNLKFNNKIIFRYKIALMLPKYGIK